MPVVIHDSVLFKNIENDAVSKLIGIYLEIPKQSFIALDEIEKYGAVSAATLRAQSAVQLTDSHVLYIKDWRPKKYEK